MKLVWCPETAAKSYMDAVKALANQNIEHTDMAGLVSAMAGGWNATLIVEAWAPGDGPATSLGLVSAARHTKANHLVVVPDQQSAVEYTETMHRAGTKAAKTVVAGEEAAKELQGVEMMVVDFRHGDAVKILQEARPGPWGMVVVCKNGGLRRGEATMVRVAGTRVVRSAFLPVGNGVEIMHVGVARGPGLGGGAGYRWFKHVDKMTGEEHVFRR